MELKKPEAGLARKWPAQGERINLTLALYKEGKSVKEIATQRDLSQETIVSHLAAAYQNGEAVDIDQFVPSQKQELITQAFQKHGTQFLTQVRKDLGANFTWEDLKLVRAKLLRQEQAAAV